jgi:hypothetical protein
MLGLQAERTSPPADITDRVMTESGNRVDLSTNTAVALGCRHGPRTHRSPRWPSSQTSGTWKSYQKRRSLATRGPSRRAGAKPDAIGWSPTRRTRRALPATPPAAAPGVAPGAVLAPVPVPFRRRHWPRLRPGFRRLWLWFGWRFRRFGPPGRLRLRGFWLRCLTSIWGGVWRHLCRALRRWAPRAHGNDLRAPGDDSQPGPPPTTRRQTCIDVLCAYLGMP